MENSVPMHISKKYLQISRLQMLKLLYWAVLCVEVLFCFKRPGSTIETANILLQKSLQCVYIVPPIFKDSMDFNSDMIAVAVRRC